MAVMIPDSCPSKATKGEKWLYRLLQDHLPDDFNVWYEPEIDLRYPDFTLLADTFGLLTLETKGWYPRQLSRITDQEAELLINHEGQSHLEVHKNPYRQVREYMFGAMHLLAKQPLLVHARGPHKGHLCFACGCGVVFTNITRAQLDVAGLGEIFPASKAICRDELDAIHDSKSDAAFIRRLKHLMPQSFPFDALTNDQRKTVHGALHKEVVVKIRPVRPASALALGDLPPDTRALDILDREQEQIARFMGEGHRIVAGVAGSGKTILLLARAKLLAMRNSQKAILILCYNNALAAYLKAQIGNDPLFRKIEIWTFPRWAEKHTGLSRDWNQEEFEGYEKRLTEAIHALAQSWPENRKYDAVLLDEAPDFREEWFGVCVSVLKGAIDGDLLVVVDGAQSVYGRPQSFTWKSVGINAQGRSRSLSKNYRNTKQIIEFAWAVAQRPQEEGEDAKAHLRVRPTLASRTGPPPAYQGCQTAGEERGLIAQLVLNFKSQGIPEEDIGVLYTRKEGKRIDELFASLQTCGKVCWVTNEADPAAKHQFMARPGVRLCTVHSAKGLQFRVVIFTGVDQLPSPMSSDETRDSNLFYVGLTRAEQHLVLTWTGRSKFTDRVLESDRAVPLERKAEVVVRWWRSDQDGTVTPQ
jgi:UvrD-like helicase C-terminal domain/AAA domain